MYFIVVAVLLGGGLWIFFTSRRSNKPKQVSLGPQLLQYNVYEMTSAELIVTVVIAMGILGGIGYVFYQHMIAALLISLAGLYYPKIRRKDLIRKRKALLQLQFKQALASLSSALGAGKSVENAFQEALVDLRLLYPDPRALIVKELETINRRIENGETIEMALKDLSERTQIDDIQQFTEVFATCKRTGGNLVHVIRRTASIIQEKLDIQQEIAVMMAQKRFESRVLAFAPVIVIAVLSFSSPDYMEPMYKGITGYLIMSAALLILLGCFGITKMIMNIKV
ncbi:type II secretion system F family protein [Paenibacillus sp. FSL H7-0331]|uniref:type II secretion system F family protein n=1 Tax=Paenibacillus sp. FSL H7-0331 TaxID=1920421 RepID=UPI0021171F9F|nr:type II secretion system F family protein [Paenibacillus sp. FSL H7-0331]